MFEVAELKIKIDKKEYERQVADMRTRLLEAQQKLESAGIPVIVIVAGVDCSGKGDVIGKLNEWLDPRYMRTQAFGESSDEERERPTHWRYWMSLPPRGRIGLYAIGWYSRGLADRVHGRIGDARMDSKFALINRFEKSLADDGALILKCWLHLSKQQQEKMVEKLESNPDTRWKITGIEKKHLKLYKKFIGIAGRMLRQTSTPHAPWLILNACDPYYRRLTVAQWIVDRINQKLEQKAEAAPIVPERAPEATQSGVSLLASLDLRLKLSKSDYQERLARYQGKISRLTRQARQQKRSTLLVFEGWDAAGKGGAIRRVTQAMDARNYRVIPVAAPTDEEKAHHYLWRFWRHLPRDGMVTIYDRSWYGRVLVERIEGYARANEWMRAYSEINDFEEELTEHGVILVKMWLHIDREEQMRRFKERENTSYKRYKITEEDYRNRDKWNLYEAAVNDMVTRTSTEYAPWRLIEAQDNYYARIRVCQEICAAYEKFLDK